MRVANLLFIFKPHDYLSTTTAYYAQSWIIHTHGPKSRPEIPGAKEGVAVDVAARHWLRLLVGIGFLPFVCLFVCLFSNNDCRRSAHVLRYISIWLLLYLSTSSKNHAINCPIHKRRKSTIAESTVFRDLLYSFGFLIIFILSRRI